MSQVLLNALLDRGLVSEEDAQKAIEASEQKNIPPVKSLVATGVISEELVSQTIAELTKMPYVDLTAQSPDPVVATKLDPEWAQRLHALPIVQRNNSILVAFSRPPSITVMDDLQRLIHLPVVAVLAAPSVLREQIDLMYGSSSEMFEVNEDMSEASFDDEEDEFMGALEDAPVVKYVNLVLTQAILERASDIHIQPTPKDVCVKFRIDGVLHERMRSPKSALPPVVSRVKILSNMDIAEKRMPQDGRISMHLNARKVDLRVVTLPTIHGEGLVLRILDTGESPVSLLDIGLSDYHQEIYTKYCTKPHGMILVTGPTGSGKSTTLTATINAIKRPEMNVITVEDPVESQIDGITQMQINRKAGLTFANALKAILRADPDTILIGEIRDTETALMAVESALTGHLVFSTLHTNDAASAVTRLTEMGIEPFLVGSALSIVAAQRLARRLCAHCKEEYMPTKEDLQLVEYPWEIFGIHELARPKGCSYCAGTGYRGRIAIHELLVVDDKIERMSNEGAHTDQIRNFAVNENGMKTMRMDGWEKVAQGVTTIEEILRVST